MTPVFRLPIILTVVHGFSCKEAAAILEIPLGTLLSRLHRGRKQLEHGLWDYAVTNGLVTTSDEDER
jgi:RNA polymerase sigma-70 factor (ECF subfamily)